MLDGASMADIEKSARGAVPEAGPRRKSTSLAKAVMIMNA